MVQPGSGIYTVRLLTWAGPSSFASMGLFRSPALHSPPNNPPSPLRSASWNCAMQFRKTLLLLPLLGSQGWLLRRVMAYIQMHRTAQLRLPVVEKSLQNLLLACLQGLLLLAFRSIVILGPDDDGCEYIAERVDQPFSPFGFGNVEFSCHAS